MNARIRTKLLVAAVTLLLGACASLTGIGDEAGEARPARSSVDPFEPANRAIASFNQTIDDIALRPIATAYARYVPEVVQMMTGNFLSNLHDPYIGLNNLLQGKPKEAASDATRFLLNTVFGFLGVGDPASDMGFRKNYEDFGQTLGVWGFDTGPFLVLPLFGPSNFRDGVGFAVDRASALPLYIDSDAFRSTVFSVELIDNRARLLPTQRLLEGALDRYLLIRDSYLQRRRNLVYDGNPPEKPEDESNR